MLQVLVDSSISSGLVATCTRNSCQNMSMIQSIGRLPQPSRLYVNSLMMAGTGPLRIGETEWIGRTRSYWSLEEPVPSERDSPK